jgi:hypothetical protein
VKRDMELIRLLLLNVEHEEGDNDKPVIEGYSDQALGHNCALIIEAGLAHGEVLEDERGVPRGAVLLRLTWAGHDFLDSTRDSTTWNNAKNVVLKQGASWTFEMLKEYLKWEVRQRLHLPTS